VILSRDHPFVLLGIVDKDRVPCGGDAKYNTWHFEVRKWAGAIGQSTYQMMGQGRFQFGHWKDGHKWYTQITAMKADKDNSNDQPGLVKMAYCAKNVNDALASCLGEPVSGDDAADNIFIYLTYPAR